MIYLSANQWKKRHFSAEFVLLPLNKYARIRDKFVSENQYHSIHFFPWILDPWSHIFKTIFSVTCASDLLKWKNISHANHGNNTASCWFYLIWSLYYYDDCFVLPRILVFISYEARYPLAVISFYHSSEVNWNNLQACDWLFSTLHSLILCCNATIITRAKHDKLLSDCHIAYC